MQARTMSGCWLSRELKDTTSTEAITFAENVTLRFCNYFSTVQSLSLKMRSNYPGIKLEPALGT